MADYRGKTPAAPREAPGPKRFVGGFIDEKVARSFGHYARKLDVSVNAALQAAMEKWNRWRKGEMTRQRNARETRP
jgi:hypothetical protein